MDVFKSVQEEYDAEGIPWTHVDFEVAFSFLSFLCVSLMCVADHLVDRRGGGDLEVPAFSCHSLELGTGYMCSMC